MTTYRARIKVTVEFEEGSTETPKNTKYGIVTSAMDADAYAIGRAVQDTIEVHLENKPQLSKLEDFN